MNSKVNAIAIFVLCLSLFSCIKIEDKSGPLNGRLQLLCRAPWKIISEIYNDSDYWKDMDTCNKDDRFIFNTNKHYSVDEGQLICDSFLPQTKDRAWSFSKDQSRLILGQGGPDSSSYFIEEISNEKLIISLDLGGTILQVRFAH